MKRKCFCVLGLAILTGCQSERPQPGAIAQEWAMNTSQMGIKPVYPLTEMSPGDVFLSVGYNVDSMADIPTKGYDIQPMIYSHLDLTGIPTHEQERGRFVYPIDTADSKKPDFKGIPSNNRANCSVSFPGYSFASTLDYNLGAEVPTSVWAAIFSTAHKSKYSVSYSVPSSQCLRIQVDRLMPLATRYLYNLDASQVNDMKNASLSLAIPADLREKYSARPIVVIPYIVYIADSLDVTISSLDGSSTQLSATTLSLVELSDKKQLLETKIRQLGGQPGSSGAVSSGGEGSEGNPLAEPEESANAQESAKLDAEAKAGEAAEAAVPEAEAQGQQGTKPTAALPKDQLASLQAQLTSVEQQLNATVKASTPSLPGVTGSVTRLSTTGVTLHQVFNPPLAIGYRALQFELPSYANSVAQVAPEKVPFLLLKKDLGLDEMRMEQPVKEVKDIPQPRKIYYSPLQ